LLAEIERALAEPNVVWFLVGGYLAGSIPFGFLIARFFAKKDVREAGSGNIGATNVARVVGKKLGLLTLFLDAMKGAIPVLVVGSLAAPSERVVLETATGFLAFVGHCYPVWLKFKGGKGVATGLGVLLATLPLYALGGFGVFAVVFALSKTVSLGSMLAAAGLFVGFIVFHPLDGTIPFFAAMLVILVWKHRGNISRLLKKQELKL